MFDWVVRSLRCLPSFSSDLLFGRRFDQRGDLAAGQRVEGGSSATGGPALGGQIQYKIDIWDPKLIGRGRVQQVPAYEGHLYSEKRWWDLQVTGKGKWPRQGSGRQAKFDCTVV